MPVLREGGRQIRERIRTRKVVIAILANKRIGGEDRIGVEYVRPTGSYIHGIDEDSLVLPGSCLIELIRLLEPGARIIQVEVKVVLRTGLKIDAVKYVLGITLVVDRGKFWRVEKPAGLQ